MSLMGHPALQLLAGLLGQRESASNDSPIGSSIFAGFTSEQWAVGHEMLPKAALLRGSEPSPNIWYFWPIRYDTRRYFNVRSKADMSQLNLPHGNYN